MQSAHELICHVNFSVTAPKREFISRARAVAAWRRVGCVVEPIFVDAHGVPVSEKSALTMRERVESAIRELSRGPKEHARQTIASLEALRKTDAEQVDDLLTSVYKMYAKGNRSSDILEAFLDTFERWLTADGVAKVDILFERVDLDRAPESLGVLMLATTRLTRAHFMQRHTFIARLERWLIGRGGRTLRDVDNMLRGLRE